MEQSRKVLEAQTKAAIVTDCRSMYDILTRTAVPSCSEHRTTIECLLIRERLKSNCDVRWVTSQAMLADCLIKSMDASILRQCLASGKYSLFDEDEILKKRADNRQRLLWVKSNGKNDVVPASQGASEKNIEESCHLHVQSSEKSEPQDFWQVGSGGTIIRVHVVPRINRFVPIGVVGCPVNIKDLRAIRETRVKGWKSERDYWTGSRGAAPFDFVWTGETVFHRKFESMKASGEGVSVNKEGV